MKCQFSIFNGNPSSKLRENVREVDFQRRPKTAEKRLNKREAALVNV